jgi:hypothetical protein
MWQNVVAAVRFPGTSLKQVVERHCAALLLSGHCIRAIYDMQRLLTVAMSGFVTGLNAGSQPIGIRSLPRESKGMVRTGTARTGARPVSRTPVFSRTRFITTEVCAWGTLRVMRLSELPPRGGAMRSVFLATSTACQRASKLAASASAVIEKAA